MGGATKGLRRKTNDLAKSAQRKAHQTSPAAKARNINTADSASRSPPILWRGGEADRRVLAEASVTGSIVRKFITGVYRNAGAKTSGRNAPNPNKNIADNKESRK